jgi:hypothetical protein
MIFRKYPRSTFAGAAITVGIYGGVVTADCLHVDKDKSDLADAPRGAMYFPASGWSASTSSMTFSDGYVSLAMPDMTGDATIETTIVGTDPPIDILCLRRSHGLRRKSHNVDYDSVAKSR